MAGSFLIQYIKDYHLHPLKSLCCQGLDRAGWLATGAKAKGICCFWVGGLQLSY